MTPAAGITAFTVEDADERDLRGCHRVMLARQLTDRPDEPRLGYESCVGRLRTPFPGFGPVRHWAARVDGEVVGLATVHFAEAANSHLGLTDVVVHPESRRRGIGTALLRALLPDLRARHRTAVEGWQVTRGGDGEAWASALGFRTVYTSLLQSLPVPEVDPDLWDVEDPPGYRLERWRGASPEHLLPSYLGARAAIHDVPVDDLGVPSPRWTAELVRHHEADLRGRGVELLGVVAVHEESGAVVGVTEIEVHPHRPHLPFQRDTAVVAAHRGRGLGRWMKADMIHWLLDDFPDVEGVHTATGAENTHMSRVNLSLGFTTVRTMLAVRRGVGELESALAAG
ncbi:GNAT family N-acetyltransferase [Actinosynnema sp. NPDC023587]|uniref:GNAT family N-acetyltransferase n=1 Tax=Actinosynnema sp. NPDC023587 TaxID=3154695 RepID=UPI0033DC9A19